MEILLLILGVIGVVAAVASIAALVLVVGVALSAWEAWWLFPFWSMIMVPLGVPQITFWHFLALNVFVCTIIQRHHAADSVALDSKNTSVPAKTRRDTSIYLYTGRILGPVFAWVILKWVMS